jgi:hypothetical protein
VSSTKAANLLWYRFETDNGSPVSDNQVISRLDDSGTGGNHGTGVSGTPEYRNQTPDKYIIPDALPNNYSGRFDSSSNEYVNDGSDVSVVGSGSFTIEAFARRMTAVPVESNPTPIIAIVNGLSSSNAGWQLGYDDSFGGSKLWLILHDTGSGVVDLRDRRADAPGLLNDGDWHHLAAVVDRTNDLVRLYIDYVQAGSDFDISGLSGDLDGETGSGSLRVGAAYNYIRFWNGYLDEIRVTDAALSVDQFMQAVVPEPASAMLLAGVALAGLLRRKPMDGVRA